MKINGYWKAASLLTVVIVAMVLYGNFKKPDISENTLKADTFERLKRIRLSKKEEILKYFAEIQAKAENVENDELLLAIFDGIKKNNYYIPTKVEFALDVHFVRYYGNFYDILFVDTTGYVFHSIKKESDYLTNVIKDMPETALSKRLAGKQEVFFVEYEYYRPSDEPAAFFIMPRKNGGVLEGWIILQASTNRINAMLTDYKNLGRTGEVYLVNREKMMLSDSRFIEDSTILKLSVDTEAVEDAVSGKTGEKIIVDYRGKKVFSSYEEFKSFGASWILIAEIDEDEIYTDFYVKHKKYLSDKIVEYLKDKKQSQRRIENGREDVKRVDLNEFAKATPGMALKTYGVSTCTSVIIMNPGKFGYLAHITPDDSLYAETGLITGVFAAEKNNLLREVLERLERYDVYPYEKEKLEIYIIAPHDFTFRQALDRLIENGYELSNIHYAYNPLANNATVILDMDSNKIEILWRYENGYKVEFGSDVENLDAVLKRIIRESA